MNGPSASSPFCRAFQRDQKRRAILSMAASLFNVQGARATTLDDISARLDLNKASLYYYVRSKDDLIRQCYLASCETLLAMADAADADAPDGAGKLAGFICRFFMTWQAIMEGRHEHMAVLSELRGLKPEQRKEVSGRYTVVQERIRSFVRQGIDDGSLENAAEIDTTLAVFGLLQLTVLWLPRIETTDFGRAAEVFTDIVMNGISARPTRGPDALTSISGPPGPSDGNRDETPQDAFCRSASSFFNFKGFKGTSLDEIAEDLGVTKGAFYHHVADKDELLHRCFRRTLAIIEAVQGEATELAETGLEALQYCACHLFRIQNSASGPLIRFNLILSLPARNRKEVLDAIARLSDRFGRMIRDGIEDGSIRPVDPYIAEQILLSAVDLSTELQWLRPVTDPAKDCGRFFTFYFSGVTRH
jgi:AcrR family transcriptional regulator